jgi:hypothetical protein
MATISTAIENTLRRIGTVAGVSGKNVRAVWRGISKEFGRFVDYRDLVKCAVVPSEDLCEESFDDLENKYGLPEAEEMTVDEQIARIVERASIRGSGGKDWFEAQIQAAGFPLYVIENSPQPEVQTQFGDVQFSPTTQFALMPKRIDPLTVPGILITSSAYSAGAGRLATESQFGIGMQFGTSFFGTRDPNYIFPQPRDRQLPTDTQKWSRIFFLSPFPDRLASIDELVLLSAEKIRYLEKLVQTIKYLHLWCIAQVQEDIVLTTEGGEILTTEDGISLAG